MHVDYHYWGNLWTDSFMSMKSGFLIASILPKSLSCVGWIPSRKRRIQAWLHAGSLLGQGWRGVLGLLKRSFLWNWKPRKHIFVWGPKLKPSQSRLTCNSGKLEGSLEDKRSPRRGEGYQLGSAVCDATPSQRVAAPSTCPTSISSDHSPGGLQRGLPLAQLASFVYVSATGKWVSLLGFVRNVANKWDIKLSFLCKRSDSGWHTRHGSIYRSSQALQPVSFRIHKYFCALLHIQLPKELHSVSSVLKCNKVRQRGH